MYMALLISLSILDGERCMEGINSLIDFYHLVYFSILFGGIGV